MRATQALPLCLVAAAAACDDGSAEAPRLPHPMVVDASAAVAAVTSDLGYTVTITGARAALRDLEFTTDGETHLALLERVGRWLIPAAHAHPGHGGGGEVVGELRGKLLVDWLKRDAPLGTALLLASKYSGANFGFRLAEAGELPAGDPLVGHTFHFEGTATRAGRTVSFAALLAVDPAAELVGAPFEHEVLGNRGLALGLRLLPADPTEPTDTIWNGLDFFALAADGTTVRIAPGQEAHNLLVRSLRTHDHYDVTPH